MKHVTFNCTYIKNRDFWFSKDKKKPELIAISYLMSMTGVNRVFDESDLYELIWRTVSNVQEQSVAYNYFSLNDIIYFKWNNEPFTLKVKDFYEFIGFELIDALSNKTDRDYWLEHRKAFWKGATITMLFEGDFQIYSPMPEATLIREDGEIINQIIIKAPEELRKEVPQEICKQADIIASQVIKDVGSEPFEWLHKNHQEKFKELKKRNCEIIIPDFNFEEVDVKLQYEIWKNWWPNLEHLDDPDERDWIGKCARLAYYWANGFVQDSKGNKTGDLFGLGYVDERIDLDYEDYQLRDDLGLYNLVETYYQENLEAILHLLYDEEVAKLA